MLTRWTSYFNCDLSLNLCILGRLRKIKWLTVLHNFIYLSSRAHRKKGLTFFRESWRKLILNIKMFLWFGWKCHVFKSKALIYIWLVHQKQLDIITFKDTKNCAFDITLILFILGLDTYHMAKFNWRPLKLLYTLIFW